MADVGIRIVGMLIRMYLFSNFIILQGAFCISEYKINSVKFSFAFINISIIFREMYETFRITFRKIYETYIIKRIH